jgi:hypothetical protein
MQPKFAVDGAGWSVSFQRRVGAANRGAIPWVALDSPSGRMRVLIPLRAGEALWIAVLSAPAVVVEGHAGDRPLRVEQLPPTRDGNVLQMLDSVLVSNRWVPIDAASILCADDRNALGDDHDQLTIRLKNPPRTEDQWIAVVPATPSLYETLSGLSAPGPTSEEDGYRGWRLP